MPRNKKRKKYQSSRGQGSESVPETAGTTTSTATNSVVVAYSTEPSDDRTKRGPGSQPGNFDDLGTWQRTNSASQASPVVSDSTFPSQRDDSTENAPSVQTFALLEELARLRIENESLKSKGYSLRVSSQELKTNIKDYIDMRKNVLDEPREDFVFEGAKISSEGNFEVLLRGHGFIDKTGAYRTLFENVDEKLRRISYHVQCPRRFGKTLLADFIRTMLSLSANNLPEKEHYMDVLRKARSLDEGDFFVQRMLSPCVSINFSDVVDVQGARLALVQAFANEGVDVENKADSSCSGIFRKGIQGLQELWSEAAAEYPKIVSTRVIVLIDEYDYPFRDYLLQELENGTRHARLHTDSQANNDKQVDTETETVQGKDAHVDTDIKTDTSVYPGESCPPELKEIHLLMQTVKAVDKNLRASFVVTLLSLANIGLTYLESDSIAHDASYHGVVGVNRSQIENAFGAMPPRRMGSRWETDPVQRAYTLEKDKGRSGALVYHLAAYLDNPLDYFAERYNGHQFCLAETTQEIQKLGPLAAPCDVFHFFHAIKLSSAFRDVWAHSWGESHVKLLFGCSKPGQSILRPLLGGTLTRDQIIGNASFQDCYKRSLDFSCLLRLFLEYGYLRIAEVESEGEEKSKEGEEKKHRFRLRPSSSVEICKPAQSIQEYLQKLHPAFKALYLSDEMFHSLKKVKRLRKGFSASRGTFDYHLLWQLFLAKEHIGFLATGGYNDLMREYETQFFTMLQLRENWRHEDVETSWEERAEKENRESGEIQIIRLDILIKIAKVVAGCIELKILKGASYESNKNAARTLLHIAWNQALNHEQTYRDKKFVSIVFYAVVYILDCEGNTEILLRRGIDGKQYEEFLLPKSTGGSESVSQSAEFLGNPEIKYSPRLLNNIQSLPTGGPTCQSSAQAAPSQGG